MLAIMYNFDVARNILVPHYEGGSSFPIIKFEVIDYQNHRIMHASMFILHDS